MFPWPSHFPTHVITISNEERFPVKLHTVQGLYYNPYCKTSRAEMTGKVSKIKLKI